MDPQMKMKITKVETERKMIRRKEEKSPKVHGIGSPFSILGCKWLHAMYTDSNRCRHMSRLCLSGYGSLDGWRSCLWGSVPACGD